jgi:hypothetical protein
MLQQLFFNPPIIFMFFEVLLLFTLIPIYFHHISVELELIDQLLIIIFKGICLIPLSLIIISFRKVFVPHQLIINFIVVFIINFIFILSRIYMLKL